MVTLTELMATAELRRKAGDAELARVIFKMTQKGIAELLDGAWQLHNYVAKLKNSKVNWMEHMTVLAQSNCDKVCSGLWLKCAIDALHKNKISFVFADAL